MILGIDEVGRGPWAGPLVVGAVVLGESVPEGLTDSKKLSAKRRQVLNEEIKRSARAWGLGWVHADELDTVGLSEGLRRATIRAVEAIQVPYTQIIIDGTVNFLKETGKGPYVSTMAKADLLVPSVSAASIIAKVARDQFMAEQDEVYSGYSFAKHAGYGTALHAAAIQAHGVSPLHRRSFAPIAKHLGERVTSRSKGLAAEDAVQAYLTTRHFVIIERNWRTKWCEIDVIARKGETLYFIEVKYRAKQDQGGGAAAVTPKKVTQMKFAAELFVATRGYEGPQKLVAVAVDAMNNLSWFEVD